MGPEAVPVAADFNGNFTTLNTTTIPVGSGGTGLTAGTSGGVLYYSAAATLASSALLTLYGLLRGGGAGGAPVALAAMTNGQLAIGSTDAAPVIAALTGTAGRLTVTNGAGSITLDVGADVYRAAGTDVALADGGTGASLVDPNADRLIFWDDSAGAVAFLTAGAGLTISGTSMTAAGVTLANFYVATEETTTSTTYVALATVGEITVSPGASSNQIILLRCSMENSAAGNTCRMSVAIAGATAVDADGFFAVTGTSTFAMSAHTYASAVANASTHATRFSVSAGTGSFRQRRMTVIAV